MKTYTTEEMIKRLREGSKKEFKSVHNYEGNVASTYVSTSNHNNIVFKNSLGKSVPIYYIGLDWRWEEVREPVSFMKAARSEGEVMVSHVMLKGTDMQESWFMMSVLLERIVRDLSGHVLRDVIADGVWYVK